MVEEVKDQNTISQLQASGAVGQVPGAAGVGRRGQMQNDRYGDYDRMPVKKMIALYDYDPQESSPNYDAVSLITWSCIYVVILEQPFPALLLRVIGLIYISHYKFFE